MKMWVRVMVALAGCATASVAVAQTSTPLRGDIFLAGKTVVDPPPEELKNSHAYMTVTGPSALRMYQAMRARAERDECLPGRQIKRAGPLACSVAANNREPSCDFSVDLLKGELSGGRAC